MSSISNILNHTTLDLCHRDVIVESFERGKHINEFIDKNKGSIV